MNDQDRLAEIKAHPALSKGLLREETDWLVGEVERLREDRTKLSVYSGNVEAERNELRSEVERLRGRLGELEWINPCDGCDQGRCPVCDGHEGRRGHEPDCWLAAEIAKSPQPEG